MKLEVIRRLCKESLNREQYDLAHTLQLWMSGDFDAIEAAIDGKTLSGAWQASGDELPTYPEIAPKLGPMGLQNHGFVNASINIQGIEMEPDFIFEHPDSVVRAYNAAWIRDRWVSQRWEDQFYLTGIEVEANGLSSCTFGISNGKVSCRHAPYLDTLMDAAHKSPSDYRWRCDRRRLSPEECEDIYGDALTEKELDNLWELEGGCIENSAGTGYFGSTRKQPMKQIVEWSWHSRDFHVIFLGSIHGDDSIPLILNDKYEYVRADKSAGPSPFGVIPAAWWTGAWQPGQSRPVAKSQTVIRLAAMLNVVERYMMETLINGIPLTTINTSTMVDRSLADDIKDAKGWQGLSRIIAVQGSIENILQRTPAAELPHVCIILRSTLKEEINAATGVQDMMRGQAMTGEKTRYEVQSFNDQAGIQGRYLRRSYGNFVEDAVAVCRVIGAQHETAESILFLQDFGPISTKDYPVEAMLKEPIPLRVSPERLMFKTERERQEETMVKINAFILELKNAGAAIDPMKVLAKYGSVFGLRNAIEDLCYSPQELQQQKAEAQAQEMAAPMAGRV